VPLKELARRALLSAGWEPEPRPLELVVVFAVVEIVLESAAYAESVVGGNRHIAPVKQFMHVRPEEQPVVYSVNTTIVHCADVGRLEYW
jgi:hypothetical protein